MPGFQSNKDIFSHILFNHAHHYGVPEALPTLVPQIMVSKNQTLGIRVRVKLILPLYPPEVPCAENPGQREMYLL